MTFDPSHYPSNWPQLRAAVQQRAGNRCEGSPRYPDCRAENHQPHPDTGSRVVLTTAHLFDNDHQTQDIARLRAWCQKCHLDYDRPKHMRRAAETRARKRGQLALLARAS